MGAYATVNWQTGDEVTSQRLQQMAANEQYLYDKIILGDIEYRPSALGVAPAGREPGIVEAKRIGAMRIDFDSQVPVSVHYVHVDITNLAFTEPPVVTLAYNVENYFSVCHLSIADRTDYVELQFASRDGLVVQLKGSLHLHFLGR